MRRSLSVRIATLIFVALMTAPAFAASRDDSPIGDFERAISRVVQRIKNIFHPTDLADLNIPK